MAKKDGITGWVVLGALVYFLCSIYASVRLTQYLFPPNELGGAEGLVQFGIKGGVTAFFLCIFVFFGFLIGSKLIGLLPPRKD
jgi:hypothetical protein